jgi:hypothetical protein
MAIGLRIARLDCGGVMRDFSDLIGKITTQSEVQAVYERFKPYFASAAGAISTWRESDYAPEGGLALV